MAGSGYFNSCKIFKLSEIVVIIGIANALQVAFRFAGWMNTSSSEEQIVEIHSGEFEGLKGEILLSVSYDFTGLIFDCLWYVMMLFCAGSLVLAATLKNRLLIFPYMIPVSYNIVCTVKALLHQSTSDIEKVPIPIFGPEIPCSIYFMVLVIDLVLLIWSIWIVLMYYQQLLNLDHFGYDYDEEMCDVDGEWDKYAHGSESNVKNFQSLPDLSSCIFIANAPKK